ncbi:MAG: polysaccharide biosynthesis/export family protein [Phenylobacterium sp.]|uniref:SLBB domain-containing protein n=1 Tax=Phenylobacterium sp. TaxID=1871053 RepID=UPI00271C7690|nr:polysaccharide biosynthesis/export family protein [Phenylobacterium sp.]MDO9429849.1 polysaccharide biosynthesis/export family protein [Phenylobacterium sp.]
MTNRSTNLVLLGLCLVATCAPSISLAQQPGGEAPVAPPVAPLQAAPSPTPSQPGAATAEYVIGPEDIIEIEVVGQPDKARARVYTDGTVQLNLIGKLVAQGKTPKELAAEIAQALRAGGFYANPLINVEVVGFSSRYVTVLGAVATPSLVPINRPYRLSEILARVGGVQATAADYLIVRPESGDERRYLVDELSKGDVTKDPFVTPGDKIFAPAAEVFYISGQVNSPGPFPMKTDMTVMQAIARAGGLTASGSDKKVQVNRGGKKVKLAGDAKVEPGDVLVVGERLF